MGKIYKEIKKSETETTINVLYSEKLLSIYTNKIELEKQLYKILGEPKQEYIKGKSKKKRVKKAWKRQIKDTKFAKWVKICYNRICRMEKESVNYFKKKDKILY